MPVDKVKIARQFIETIPHSKALGMDITHLGDGLAEITMPYDERFIGETSGMPGGEP